jgi:hypothetical protein
MERLPSTPLPLGLAGLDHHRQASLHPTHSRSTKCQPSDGELATATDTVAPGAECPLESADPVQIGGPGEEDGQIEQGNPGEQEEGQTEGEASTPTGAGDGLSRCASLTVCCAAASRPAAPAHPRALGKRPQLSRPWSRHAIARQRRWRGWDRPDDTTPRQPKRRPARSRCTASKAV